MTKQRNKICKTVQRNEKKHQADWRTGQVEQLGFPVLNIISGEVQSYWEQPYAQPYFDNSTRREITATVGQSALLHCRVRNLGDRAVSWIRKRDLHILTVGILTYTNDQRFQSLHTEGSDEWTLRITSPQPRDSGTYECQVSTEPKISQAFRLSVVVSQQLAGWIPYEQAVEERAALLTSAGITSSRFKTCRVVKLTGAAS
ncbi:hypothetical protein RP20_CCG023742 [Aedes albopictus]|nr:hypothetical protein RP20_CCG023742 [Aedes albopictus]